MNKISIVILSRSVNTSLVAPIYSHWKCISILIKNRPQDFMTTGNYTCVLDNLYKGMSNHKPKSYTYSNRLFHSFYWYIIAWVPHHIHPLLRDVSNESIDINENVGLHALSWAQSSLQISPYWSQCKYSHRKLGSRTLVHLFIHSCFTTLINFMQQAHDRAHSHHGIVLTNKSNRMETKSYISL